MNMTPPRQTGLKSEMNENASPKRADAARTAGVSPYERYVAECLSLMLIELRALRAIERARDGALRRISAPEYSIERALPNRGNAEVPLRRDPGDLS